MIYEIDIELTPEIAEEIRQAFISRLDDKYDLVFVDYRSNINESGNEIQKCIDAESGDTLYDYNNDWISDIATENADGCLDEIKDKILGDNSLEHLHPFVEEWLDTDNNRCDIRYMIEDRDESTPMQDIIKQTRLRARAMLYTNYDCLPHNYDMGNTYSYTDYFRQIIDTLNLNPYWVMLTFHRYCIHTVGHFPDIRKRNGKEAVRYADFAEEILNQHSYGLLTFAGLLPLNELYDNNFTKIKYITIPKGNYCGMFSDWRGGGSLMDMEILRDFKIPVCRPLGTRHDKLLLHVDENGCDGHCIDSVYGLDRSYWNKPFKLKFKTHNNERN